MAKPRVFISSTFYDLRHIRNDLDEFVSGLGFESVLSEKGDIAYEHDRPLDESCYREVPNCDIFVMVVGGRYGSIASGQREELERYASVTEKEFDAAIEADIPIFVLINAPVFGEYGTYKLNRDQEDVKYAYVDSPDVFALIDKILSKPRNNPVHEFTLTGDITKWLREQWAGLFREYLARTSEQKQLQNLAGQIDAIGEVTKTLKTYMETVVSSVAGDQSRDLIASETRRLDDAAILLKASDTQVVKFLSNRYGVPKRDVVTVLATSKSFRDMSARLVEFALPGTDKEELRFSLNVLASDSSFMSDLNEVRGLYEAKPFPRRRKGEEV